VRQAAGIRLDEALLLCPHLIVVHARPRLYVEYHHRIAAAIERCIPIQQVMSCDEFACQLLGRERNRLNAIAIAYAIKNELRNVGITLRCSIGLAPNRILAKIAGDMQKPDGLMIFERRHLPRSLHSLDLSDIPFGNPPPLEEFDDSADLDRIVRPPRGIRASDLAPYQRKSNG
jgi:DNA polymerase-4